MSKSNDGVRPPASDGEPPRGLRQRMARLCLTVQNRLWSADEKWAADRGFEAERSPRGWALRVHDPRFHLREECRECGGTGQHRITVSACEECGGTGVTTLDPEDGGGS